MSCPKCGYSTMIGPIYCEGGGVYYSESLVYRCMQCGFVQHRPVLSSREGAMERIVESMTKKFDERHGKE